jgi:hypothetical protein
MLVAFEIVRSHDEMLEHAATFENNGIELLRTQYLDLLYICGWKQIDYENKLLELVDQEWIELHQKVYG